MNGWNHASQDDIGNFKKPPDPPMVSRVERSKSGREWRIGIAKSRRLLHKAKRYDYAYWHKAHLNSATVAVVAPSSALGSGSVLWGSSETPCVAIAECGE